MDKEIKTPDMDDLSRWFSAARMARYADAPDPAAPYLWDARLSKAYLEDIEHVEVLLRNFVDARLRRDCERRRGDERWFDHADLYNLGDGFRSSLAKARRRLAHEGKDATTDALVAALSLDTWRFLLVRRLEPTVWRALRDVGNGGMPHHPGTSRADFEEKVKRVYDLRNRCSHQEHLALSDRRREDGALDAYMDALDWVARRIDPEAADWIRRNSRVASVRGERPKDSPEEQSEEQPE